VNRDSGTASANGGWLRRLVRPRLNEQNMKTLTDTDPMPFGKYKGEPMQDVPASYLHYLWQNGLAADKQSNVADYIRRNINALKLEHKDGVWA